MKRRGAALLVLVLLSGASACRAAAAPKKSATDAATAQPSPRSRLAEALGRAEADVRDAREIALAHASVLVGSVRGPGGAPQLKAVLGAACGPRFCSQSALALEADSVAFLTAIDLAAPPKRLALEREPPPPRAEAFKRPALLLRARTQREGPLGPVTQEELLLVGVTQHALQMHLREPCAAQPSTSDGFETTEVQFQPAGQWPEITLLQHSVPAPGAAEALPGPPLTISLHAGPSGHYQK